MVESTGEIEPIWSPYAMMVPPFKTIQWKKRRNSPKTIPFKTINPVRWNPCLSRMVQAIWTPYPCCLMNLTYIKHPLHHPQSAIHPDHHHAHPQHHFHPENHLWSPGQRTPHPKTGRHQSEPAFIRPHDIDRGLTHGLSALLAETSPLAPYRIQWQAKVKAQEKISTQKWLLSRPS